MYIRLCILNRVQLRSKHQHTGNWSAAAWPPPPVIPTSVPLGFHSRKEKKVTLLKKSLFQFSFFSCKFLKSGSVRVQVTSCGTLRLSLNIFFKSFTWVSNDVRVILANYIYESSTKFVLQLRLLTLNFIEISWDFLWIPVNRLTFATRTHAMTTTTVWIEATTTPVNALRVSQGPTASSRQEPWVSDENAALTRDKCLCIRRMW